MIVVSAEAEIQFKGEIAVNTDKIYAEAIITEDKVARIPTSYFLYDNALVSRIIFKAVKSIGINQDIEKRHIDAIKKVLTNYEELATNALKSSVIFNAQTIAENLIEDINKYCKKNNSFSSY